MARVATYLDSIRDKKGKDHILLLDNGDILQGQPTVYYYNFIDTTTQHIASRIYDFLNYDAATIGNHDIETGHQVYDRWIAQTKVPVLGANVINTATGQPYLTPYSIFYKNGVKIAVLGLLTPAIPAWLPKNLWSGLAFEDMESAAKKWIYIIKKEENPDIIIGLFHSGNDYERCTGQYRENASLQIASTVPGFDIVLTGHDHRRFNKVIANSVGDSVAVINPANNAMAVATVDVIIEKDKDGHIVKKTIRPAIHDLDKTVPSPRYLRHFNNDLHKINTFVDRQIGSSASEFSSKDCLFGSSPFIDFIHTLQLKISGADISFAAPLSFDAVIKKGIIRVSDMFNLYKYENLLYTMALTGEEIRDYLEESYSIWISPHSSPRDHLLLFADNKPSPQNNSLKYPYYNFDSAAGINYTVDITKPKGKRIHIISMTDGTPFDPNKTYKVAVNSYRGNGGGDLITKGAGIAHEQLTQRIITATDLDLRYYLMKEIECSSTIYPKPLNNWEFIPQEIVEPLITIDKAILFPEP